MTALAAGRDTVESALVPYLSPLSFPIAAATSIYAGSMVATDSNGRAVPASATAALKIWGRAEKTVLNTVAAGFGGAGDLSVDVKPGIFAFVNGSGADAITIAHRGRLAYASDDNTVNLTDGAGLRPVAGKIYGLFGTQVLVGLGEPSIWDESDAIEAGNQVPVIRARNIVNGNVADLTAYTVASNAAVNDATLNVAGDVVLLIAQTTAAENGLYVVGTVATGAAPLTRLDPLPVGAVALADAYEVDVSVGTVFGHTKWFNSAAGTVGTSDLLFFPESVTISQALVAGTMTLTSIPILSVTKSNVLMTRRIANTSTLTVGGYCATVGGANGITAGKLGTASIVIEATVGAGTINNADISTLNITIKNR